MIHPIFCGLHNERLMIEYKVEHGTPAGNVGFSPVNLLRAATAV